MEEIERTLLVEKNQHEQYAEGAAKRNNISRAHWWISSSLLTLC
jgi:hypothetical protein